MAAKQKLYCSIRVIRGHSKGLSKQWRECVAEISSSNISFRVRSLLGIPLPIANLITGEFQVDHIQATERKVSLLERWSINSNLRFFTVETPAATLEIGVIPGDEAWFLEIIRRKTLGGI
jgi:hypothetical protein